MSIDNQIQSAQVKITERFVKIYFDEREFSSRLDNSPVAALFVQNHDDEWDLRRWLTRFSTIERIVQNTQDEPEIKNTMVVYTGLSENKRAIREIEYQWHICLEDLFNKHQVSNYEVSKALGISINTVTKYRTGLTVRDLSNRFLFILDYFANEYGDQDAWTNWQGRYVKEVLIENENDE